jgi:ADP-ribosylglycohydrolase
VWIITHDIEDSMLKEAPDLLEKIDREHPIPRSCRVGRTRIWVGEHPLANDAGGLSGRLDRLLAIGVTAFLDLGPERKRSDYQLRLAELAKKRGVAVVQVRSPLTAESYVDRAREMRSALDALDRLHREGYAIFVHATGIGGKVSAFVACHLMRAGLPTTAALERVAGIREKIRVDSGHTASPLPGEWEEVVQRWEEGLTENLLYPSSKAMRSRYLREQMRGALIGLVVGDALGVAVEADEIGYVRPVTEMTGGGPFNMQPGEWTEATSMALCLAESLCDLQEFNLKDQMERYIRRFRRAYLARSGHSREIDGPVQGAIGMFEQNREAVSWSAEPYYETTGSLGRLAPVPLFCQLYQNAIELCGESSRTTHNSPVAIDACRYLGALIQGALAGASKAELLSARYSPFPGHWDEHPLVSEIERVANGSFRNHARPPNRKKRNAAEALEAALWAFEQGRDFREGCLLAANLGDHTDTTCAIYGQLAGAYYGEEAIPAEWRRALDQKDLIDYFAEQLFQLGAGDRPGFIPVARKQQGGAMALERRAKHGSAQAALREVLGIQAQAKEEMGTFAYYMEGSMGAAAAGREMIFQLRVQVGLELVRDRD